MKVFKSKMIFLILYFLIFDSCEKNKYNEYIINPVVYSNNCDSNIKIIELSIILEKDNAFFLIVCETDNVNYILNNIFNLSLYGKRNKLFNDGNYLNVVEQNKIQFELKFSDTFEEKSILKVFFNLKYKSQICIEFKKIIENIKISDSDNNICFSEQTSYKVLDKR